MLQGKGALSAIIFGLFASAVGAARAAAPTSKPLENAPAQTARALAPTKSSHPSWPVDRRTLPNGLRVVLAPDATLPSVAVSVVYDVGGRNETRGRTGFAHLFEHMMFQGSANVARGDHFKLVTSKGGLLNGSTTADRTAYYELLPKSDLPLAIWLEADRMKSLDVTKENFDNQRQVVEEELRMRIDNVAYAPAELRLQALVYQGYFPYEHPEAGSMADLESAQFDWVKAFHDAYYVPSSAVVSLAGDFDSNQAMQQIEQLFGTIARKDRPRFEAPPLPEQTQPREAMVMDSHAAFRALMDGWAIPPSRDPDHPALDIAARILADGESSRLVRYLVRERAIASEVACGVEERRGPDMFVLSTKLAGSDAAASGPAPRMVASARKPANLETLAKLIDAELARLAKDGPSEGELERVRTRVLSQALFALESPYARAEKLAEFEISRGDARLLFDEPDRLLAVSKDDVKRVVAKYLTHNRRSRVEVRPASSPSTNGDPGATPPGAKSSGGGAS